MKKRRNGWALNVLGLFAFIAVSLCFSSCFEFSPVTSYVIFYEGETWYGGFELVEERVLTEEVDGQETTFAWQDTAKLEPIGYISERVDADEIPEKELAINCFLEVGDPVYQISFSGREWLMIEYEKLVEIGDGDEVVVRYQNYFRTMKETGAK